MQNEILLKKEIKNRQFFFNFFFFDRLVKTPSLIYGNHGALFDYLSMEADQLEEVQQTPIPRIHLQQ